MVKTVQSHSLPGTCCVPWNQPIYTFQDKLRWAALFGYQGMSILFFLKGFATWPGASMLSISHHIPLPHSRKGPPICSSLPLLKAPVRQLPTRPPQHTSLPPYHPIITMPPFYELSVAAFAQSSTSKSRWAIAVVFAPSMGHSLVYQIVGSPSDYSLDAPQSVTLKEGENGYLGKISVGVVDSERLHQLHTTLASIPIIHGNPTWGSHNWVMEGILALRRVEGYHIDKHVTQQWVSERLGGK